MAASAKIGMGILTGCIFFYLSGCGYSQEEWDQKVRENAALTDQLAKQQQANNKCAADYGAAAQELDGLKRDFQQRGVSLDNVTQDNTAAIPFLSKLPIIGYLFRSKAERAERTELMVLITPRLVRALDPDEVPPLPTRPREFLPPPDAEIGSQLEGGGGIVDAPPAGAQPAIPRR